MTATQPTLCAQLQELLDSGAANLHFEFLPDDLRRVIAALESTPADTTQAQSEALRIANEIKRRWTATAHYRPVAEIADTNALGDQLAALAQPAQAEDPSLTMGLVREVVRAARNPAAWMAWVRVEQMIASKVPPQPEAQPAATPAPAAVYRKPGRDDMMRMAEKAGVAPNTITHFEHAFLRFADMLADALAQQPAPSAEAGRSSVEDSARMVIDTFDAANNFTIPGRMHHALNHLKAVLKHAPTTPPAAAGERP